MKKLKEKEASFIKDIINENDALVEMDNKRYYLSLIEEPRQKRANDIECEKFHEKIEKTKQNILKGKRFIIDDIVEMMDQGVL